MVLLSDKHPIDLTIGQELPPTFHYAWVILRQNQTETLPGAGLYLALAVTWYRSAIDAFSHA